MAHGPDFVYTKWYAAPGASCCVRALSTLKESLGSTSGSLRSATRRAQAAATTRAARRPIVRVCRIRGLWFRAEHTQGSCSLSLTTQNTIIPRCAPMRTASVRDDAPSFEYTDAM